MANGGPSKPTSATSAPQVPAIWRPKTTEKLTMLGPGRKLQSAYASLNSAAVSHLRSSTIIRRDQYSTPPNPESEITEKAMKTCSSVGAAGGGSAMRGVFSDMAVRDLAG